MWTKPWKMGEGFLIATGLIITGLLLQLSIGPVDWDLFAWPVNGVVLACLLVTILMMHLLRKRVTAFGFMGTYAAAIPALAFASVLTVVMGLTHQQKGGAWLSDMLTFWPFVLIYTYIALILGLVILRQIITTVFSHHPSPITQHPSPITQHPSLLLHLGLFLALTTATLGNADIRRVAMWVTNNPAMANELAGAEVFHQYETFALDETTDQKVELPLAIELKKFIKEEYEDGSPRRYASQVVIYSKASLQSYAATIDVNHPAKVDGWKIYQNSYEETPLGEACQVSILELIRDPWLPAVYVGIYMMIAGAVCMLFVGGKRKR